MKIGITDTLKEDNYSPYVHWIQSVDNSVDIQKLSYKYLQSKEMNIDGLILTGGGDVHPRYYGKELQPDKTKGVNEERDEFEFALIEKALDADVPILGVCRGMQVMNVYLGGSLITDLPSEGFLDHTSPSDENATIHSVTIMNDSLLQALTGTSETEVNSFHHQSVQSLGKGLMCSGISPDKVVEAAEWVIKESMPFLMLVQWHPERMMNTFLSQKIASIFLREVYNKQSHTKNYHVIAN